MASTDFYRTDNSFDAGGLNDTTRTFRHENKMEMFLLRRFPRNIYHDIRFYCRCWDVREGCPPLPLLAVLTGRALFAVPIARTTDGQRGRHPALHTAISLTDVTDVRVEHEAPSHLRLPPNTCCHVVSLSLRDKQIDKETSSFGELDSPRPPSQISTHSTAAFWRPGRRTPLKPLLENISGSTQDRKFNRKPETCVQLLVLGSDHELARHLQTCWHAHLQRATLALAEMIDNQRPQELSLRSYFRCGALWKDERLPLLLSSRLQQLLKRGRREVWFEDDGLGKEAGEQSPARIVLLLLSWLLDSLRSAECAEARDQVLGRGTGTLMQNLLLLAVYVGGQPFSRGNEVSEEELNLGYVTAAIITELLECCRRLKFSCPNLLAGADVTPFMTRSGAQVLTILRPKMRVSPMRSPSSSSMSMGMPNAQDSRPSSQLSLPAQLLQNNNTWTNYTAYRLDSPHLTPERAVQLLQQLYVMKQLTDHLELARSWLKTSFREELRYYLRWDAVSPKIPDRYPVKQLMPSLLKDLGKCAGISTTHF